MRLSDNAASTGVAGITLIPALSWLRRQIHAPKAGVLDSAVSTAGVPARRCRAGVRHQW